jgi:hypothetical protein
MSSPRSYIFNHLPLQKKYVRDIRKEDTGKKLILYCLMSFKRERKNSQGLSRDKGKEIYDD